MKKIFNFTKKKKLPSGTPDNGSVLSAGYEIKEKDLGKVHKAASAGDVSKLKQLSKKNDLNQLDKENRTALHIACANGHIDVVQFLVESKAKLNLCDNQNKSPLMKAVECQHDRCVSVLLENHAEPGLVDIKGNTALHLAAIIPAVSAVMLLLEHGANINAQNKDGFTPLVVAVRDNHVEMAELLLKEGADVNVSDQGQRSPLMMAACNGHINMLRLLLQFDADVTLKDSKGWSSDDYAVINGHHACSHLIIEHGTKRNAMPSPSHQMSKKKKQSLIGSPAHGVEAGFALGGPATDKDDTEDNSQSESISRASKSAAEWPSSDDDDELDLSPKKQQKPNLKELIASKKGEHAASAVPETSLSGAESEPESEDRVQRTPSLSKALPPGQAPQLPVAPSPASSSKAPQMTSAPRRTSRKREDSTEGEEDDEEEEEEERDDDEEEEEDEEDEEEEEDDDDGDLKDEREQVEEGGDSAVATTTVPESEASKDAQRDFLTELGLEKGEEDEDSWDSESRSESPKKIRDGDQRSSAKPHKEMSTVKEEKEAVRNDDSGDAGDGNGGNDVADDDDAPQEKTEKAKWEPLSVLRKLEGEADRKTDVMEEFGLGDVDDLEDASDWDSASTASRASRRTLPGRRVASPGVEELPEASTPSPTPAPVPQPPAQDAERDAIAAVPPADHGASPLPSPRSFTSHAPPRSLPLPLPQPRSRKWQPQKPGSEEESDWDSDNASSPASPVKTDDHLAHIPETLAALRPGSAVREPSPDARDHDSSPEPEEQPQKVREDEVKAEMEVRKPRVSGGSEGCEEEEDGEEAEEAESGLGHLGGVQRGNGADPRSKRAKSANRVPVQPHAPLQQKHSSITSGRQELVRGAQRSRAPQATGRVNGDPLSVFDDSTLSEVSDDGGRSPSAGRWTEENSGAMEMAEDFDELTQSSDTATDDIDSPTAGYRHASLLIQQLDCATLDSRSMVKLQNIFHEYERTIQKAKSRLGHQTGKVSQLEMERGELRSTLDEVKEVKAALERQQLELQTELNNLKFQLKQEQENHRNASMMYNTTREKLRRTEEQQRMEVEDKQRAELTLRNLELEMRTLVNNIKQLEEDSSESQRLLAQERSTRTLQENLLNNHLRKQQEIEEENRRNVSKSNEALSQLTEASDRERELLQQTSVLHEELTILKTELQRSRATSSLEESRLTEEAEALKERLEDARRDLKLNEDALTQTVFQYNNQLANLRAELSASTARLEHERQAREALETDVASTRNRLTGALQEAERCQATRTEAEKALLREKEERQRASDKHTGHAASQREAVSTLSQKLAGAEGRANSMENEVHRATLQLTEKSLLLDTLQREKDQAAARVKELEASLLAEREQASRAGARQEASQERLVQAQSDGMLLRQQLEEAQNKGVAKERAVTDAQERFSDILSKLRLDCEDRVQLVEERSRELAGKAADLREQVHKLEEEKGGRETGVRQLQQELADSLKKLSMSEASLEVNTRYRNDLEEEKARLHKDMDRLKGKLAESEDQYVDSERRINGLKSSLDEREREHSTTAQRLQEALSASGGSSTTIRQLEEAVQRLEIDNARLEAAAKQQFNKIDALQKGSQEAAMVRSRLEDMVSNLQGSKMNLEDQLNREVQKQSVLSHTAHDSQALWEEELKSRSRLGLRLAELEKEKGELSGQMDLERRKAKKIAEQKKAADIRLDQEMTRNTELQKEMYRLRTLLKTAKKRLREQDGGGGGGGGADFGSPMSSHRGDMGRYGQSEGAIGRMKDKVDELHVQLEREASRCSQLDQVNVGLKEQLASLKGLSRSNERLERSKQKLEEEVSGLRRQVEAGVVEQSQAEHYRRDAEERARLEIRQKLEEVNLFLQSQAASQDALDQMKSANEANLRSQLEQRIRDLEGELGRARSTQQDSLSQRDSTHTELERYRLLYTEELRLRKSLAAKLERSNSRLAEANGKLLSERHRSKSLIASSIVNGSLGPPSLDMGSLGSPGTYGGTLGPLNRSLGLGFPLLSPVMDGQNSRVEDYLAKMQRELEKNISKELDHATAELDGGSARVSPVGSASGSSHGAELDPLSRARQQYVEVLKKNYMI